MAFMFKHKFLKRFAEKHYEPWHGLKQLHLSSESTDKLRLRKKFIW